MRPIVRLQKTLALIPILAIAGSLLAAPLTARADDKGKKGDDGGIIVGTPIIIKDKKQPPPPPKKKDGVQAETQQNDTF